MNMIYRDNVDKIKIDLYNNLITYEEALNLLIPIVNNINIKGKRIAKKYNRKYYKLSVKRVLHSI